MRISDWSSDVCSSDLDKATRESFDPKDGVGSFCQDRAQEHGLITRGMGDSLAFSPPLIITGAEIDEMLKRFGKALDDTAAMVEQKKQSGRASCRERA